MDRGVSHADNEEMLGAAALDALPLDEAAALDDHLRGCGTCRATLDELRATVSDLMPDVPPPPGLWDRIVDQLDVEETRRSAVGAGEDPGDELARRRGVGARRWPSVALGVAAAATVACGVLGVALADSRSRVHDLEQVVANGDPTKDPTATALALVGPEARVEVVLLDDGRGVVVDDTLPVLPPDRTYQLWALFDNEQVSLGILGHDPGNARFHLDQLSGRVDELVVTNEAAPGSQQPFGDDVARAEV